MTLLPRLVREIDRRAFAIMGDTMPPRDPDGDEEDNDEDEEDKTDEPPACASRMKTKQGAYTQPELRKA
jgi:hypothetical protein